MQGYNSFSRLAYRLDMSRSIKASSPIVQNVVQIAELNGLSVGSSFDRGFEPVSTNSGKPVVKE
jgi:hypothetical protein